MILWDRYIPDNNTFDEKPKNILCVRLDNMGDLLMTTPAFRAIKESIPDSKITLLTSSAGSKITPFIPYIDEVITFDAPWVKNFVVHPDSKATLQLIKQLEERNFDLAIIHTVYSQNPMPASTICFLANIPRRMAYCHENVYQLLTDWVKDPEPSEVIRHEVRRQLDLVSILGCKTSDERLSLKVPLRVLPSLNKKLKQSGLDSIKPFVLMHTGASSPRRIYSSRGFISVGKQLVKKLGYQLILTGLEYEKDTILAIKKGIGEGAVSLAGKLSLSEFITLIKVSSLLISNNTGPVHIAAAVGTPVVDLYAKTNPQHTPWMVPSKVLTFDPPSPKKDESMKQVTPDQVVEAALQLLDLNKRRFRIKEPELAYM